MTRLAHLFDLTGRRALVTGGNSGIGLDMARALGLQGAQVVLVARDADKLTRAAAELTGQGISAQALPADLANADGVAQCIAQAGVVDILVNAAGMNLRQPFGDVTAAALDAQMALPARTVPAGARIGPWHGGAGMGARA